MSTSGTNQIRVMRIISRMNVGGPAVQISGLMRGLDASRFEQRLYTGYCSVNEADYLDEVANDITAIRIPEFGRNVSLFSDTKVLIAIIREIWKFRPHLIHTHTAKAGFLGRIASIISLHPTIRVHTFHGHLLNGYFCPIKRRALVLIEKCLALFTHKLIAVGEKVKNDLVDAGIGNHEKFEVVPPGLEIQQLPPKKESRVSLDIFSSKLQCAFIGRVTQIKRPDRFLDVVSELKARGIGVEFLIVGGGELLDMCQERVEYEKLPIKFLGWQSDIENVLSASDMVILTSDNEGMPISLIQAGMAGRAVVAVDVGSISEVVIDNVTGLLSSSAITEIADAVEKLACSEGLRDQLGTAARDFTLAKFGVRRLVHNHEELYMTLVSNHTKF